MLDVKFFVKLLNLSQKEKILLDLYIKKSVTKEETDHLLYDFDYDIEKEKLTFNFLLAQLFQNNPQIEIPKDIKPRLEGVLRLFQYYNVPLLLGLKQLSKKLNENDIPVLLVKGAAMRILEPNKARMMYDADCAVPKEKFDKAVEISKSLGFKINGIYTNAFAIIKDSKQQIDLHHSLVKTYKDSNKIYKQLFDNAKKYNFYGSTVLIPNTEDFIFLLFNNGFDNIIYTQPFYKNVSWLFDGIYIIKNNKNINWNIIFEKAKETETLAQIKVMLELFNFFAPDIISKDIISAICLSEKEQKNFDFYIKTHLFFSKAQHLKIQIKQATFFNKLPFVYQFLYLKIIQKIPIIKNLFFDKVANRMFKI